jgi:hypothetical protein
LDTVKFEGMAAFTPANELGASGLVLNHEMNRPR